LALNSFDLNAEGAKELLEIQGIGLPVPPRRGTLLVHILDQEAGFSRRATLNLGKGRLPAFQRM